MTFSYECPALVDAETWRKAQRITSLHKGRVNPYGLLSRIFHQHPDETLVPMRGQSYGKKDGGRRYRCKDGWGKNCPGIGLLNGGSRVQTSLRAQEVEGAVIDWIIQLTKDPGAYQTAVLAATEAAEALNIEPDTRDLERRIAAAQRKIDRLVGLYSDGIMEKNELYEKLKSPQAQLAQYKELHTIALEQHTDAPQAPLTIDALFAMTIAEGEDWASEIEPERGSAQWLDEFHRASHAETLPTWAIEELRLLAYALEIKVIVERGDDEKPKYHLWARNLTNSAALETDRRTCGNRCAPRNRARLDREM